MKYCRKEDDVFYHMVMQIQRQRQRQRQIQIQNAQINKLSIWGSARKTQHVAYF